MLVSLEAARDGLAAQPFSVLLGAELRSFTSGGAELMVPITGSLLQQHGFVHGGVLSYLADNAITLAAASVMGAAVVTSELKINYVRPGLGEALLARATVAYAGKSQAVGRCDVFALTGEREVLCAVAQGTVARLARREDGPA